MKAFKRYEDAKAHAEAVTRQYRLPTGIHRDYFGEWVVTFLPRKEHRSGSELRWEAVEP